ncbi:MAG: TIGR03986 family CRISPR-associated RAMP protein [Intestinibacter bartlettii]|uniref:TIGR03986 family type III CRISPR-associated RAMP protein n=1 Tax=Intestinibacter bartlettii TaxID=261299 RepID=UPI0039A2EAE7
MANNNFKNNNYNKYNNVKKNYNNKFKNNGYNNNKRQNNKASTKAEFDAVAPYNFIRFPKETFIRYESVDDIPSFERFDKDLNTGYINYEFINETPIFVGSQKDKNETVVDFFKNANNQFCIPGSSIKGVIRKNTEVLGFGYPEFVEDNLYLYRKFAAADTSKDQYKKVISLKKGESIDSVVSAGYIYKEGKEYYLKPAKKINGKTFFAISETLLRKQHIPENKINYMYKKSLLDFNGKGLDAWNKFANDKRNRNKYYEPYSVDITFNVDSENHFKKISLGKDGIYKGVLCNSNSLGVKKKHYIVNEIDKNQKAYKLDDREVLAYKNDCETNKQRTNKEYYYLPGEKGSYGDVLPFFYKIEDGKVKYFGRSPYLRIFYKKSVRDCILTKKNRGIDYPSALYGYTKDGNGPTSTQENNFKSRVSFSDAICTNPKIIKEERKLALSGPKPTSYTMYLRQDGIELKREIDTYSTDGNVEVRGSKFYWLHKNPTYKVDPDVSENILTRVKNMVQKGSTFKGKIYFENLTNDELGLLLLSLNFDSDCKENIGMGKPLGYGKIQIKNVELNIENIQDKFDSFDCNCVKSKNIEEYKADYMDYMDSYTEKVYGKTYYNVDEIGDFIDSRKMELEEKEVEYMPLKLFRKSKILAETYKIADEYYK